MLFLALLANVNYIQFVRPTSLNAKNGNKRVIDEEFSRERGADPRRRRAGRRERQVQRRVQVPAHATPSRTVRAGHRLLLLLSTDRGDRAHREPRPVRQRQPAVRQPRRRPRRQRAAQGRQRRLTIDPVAQTGGVRRARRALGDDDQGAVVALDPTTGAILAMVSQPSYNPNLLASHDFDESSRTYDEPATPTRRSRCSTAATQQTLPPGSTFKLVTAAAALSNGYSTPTPWSRPARRSTLPGDHGDTPDQQRRRQHCGGKRITFERGAGRLLQRRLRRPRAQARRRGDLQEQAETFGFDERLPRRARRRRPSRLPDRHRTSRRRAVRRSASTTCAATPAADGDGRGRHRQRRHVMKPYVVETSASPDLDVLDETEPEGCTRRSRATSADELTQMMVGTVDERHRQPRRDRGRRGRRQDRHRAVARGPAAVRLVSSPSRRPTTRRSRSRCSSSRPGPRATRSPAAGLAGPIAKAVMEAVINDEAAVDSAHDGRPETRFDRPGDCDTRRPTMNQDRPGRRPLRARRAARPRRHGRGPHRQRPAPRPHRRDQAAAGRPRQRPDVPGPVPPRGAVGRLAQPPVDRRGLRHRRGARHRRPRRHAALHRHGVRRGPDAARHPARGPQDPARARAGDHRRRARRRSTTATAPASSTATSSPPTSCSRRAARSRSWTSASPAPSPTPRRR